LAKTDWRDLLMGSGLGHANWPAAFEREFGVTPGAGTHE
jgi:hypothetical protein